jgi:peptide-methionine (S)-S-oxide reductase
MSTRKAKATTNHSKPRTPSEEAQSSAKARVVQGSRKKPSRGTSQPSKERLSRSLNSQRTKSASRGEIRAKSSTRQPMAERYLVPTMLWGNGKNRMPAPEEALPGRSGPAFEVPERHAVLGTPLMPPFPDGTEVAYFALGCFWGAERLYWTLDGVYATAVGYMDGTTPNPTYEEVCSGQTGHAEAVLVAFDPQQISYARLLEVFFEEHNPTQGMRQGNDVGTQYRSGIYFANDAQKATAEMARDAYDEALRAAGHEPITTEIEPAMPFYYAEDYHQQYLHKVPNGYCGLAGTGVSCRIPSAAS